MVSDGTIRQEKPMPRPELSYLRMFSDAGAGWQQRGQYAIWTGESTDGGSGHRLLERLGDRVAPIERSDGGAVLHRIAAGIPFTIEALMGFWLTFDSDAMWLDTPSPSGRYAMLAVGGSAGKPESAVIDWTCSHCGNAIYPHALKIRPKAFAAFLQEACSLAEEFNADSKIRVCGHCNAAHPPEIMTKLNESRRSLGSRSQE